jgi:hypothetical protein
MTLSADIRTQRLHAVDGHCADFIADCVRRGEAGRVIARADLELLMDLARLIGLGVRSWASIFARLDLAAAADFDRHRAAALVLETVFDELLEPPAWRVLAAGVDLAMETV